MKYLVIMTLPEEDGAAGSIVAQLKQKLDVEEVLYTDTMNLHGCIGCNDCWLKTPGLCSVKDDYEQILIRFLQVDRVIFVTEAKLGFVSYKMKNLMDRILPLATMYLKFEDGQMRHYSRYGKCADAVLLYTGEADGAFLNRWLDRAMLNMHAKSLGTYEFEKWEEMYHALGHH